METLVDDFVTFYIPEIADVIGDRKEVTGDDLDKLKYTEQVIQEVLRMYPPVSLMTKESPKGGVTLCSYYVPEGTPMSFVTSLMCRNPEYFNDPDTFDPSRFDADKTRLLSEIADVLGDRKEVTGDDLDKLKYTKQVFQEVLRMYPPVDSIYKESPKGGLMLSGYYIPQYTNMLGSVPWWVLYPGGGLLLLVTTAFLLFSLYVAYIHWKYSHIPSPKMGSFFLGHIPSMIAMREESGNEFEPFSNLVGRWAEQAGDFFVVFFLINPLVLTTNPDAVKRVASDENISKAASSNSRISSVFGKRFLGQGLVTILDYETWKPRRKLYDPSFKRTSLKDYLPVFNECVDTFLERLRPHADGKTEVSMKEAFHEATLDVISKVAFSSDFSKTWDSKRLGLKYTTNSELSHLSSVSFKGVQKSFITTFPSLFPLLHPKETEMYHEAVGAMRRIGRDCIEKRIKAVTSGEEVPNDILTQILQSSIADKSVDMETLVDDFVTFYIAGQETTANTLSFAIILIQQHSEVLDSLLSEITDVIGDRKEVTADDLDKLKYTEQVIQEVLRMYPPVNAVTKESPKGGVTLCSYYVPEGTPMSFVTALMCRNPEYFNDPDTFDPSRFDADKTRPGPFVYFPFSVGHRSCIGRHFAMIEAKVILARLLQTFMVTLPPSYKLVVEQLATQQPKGNIACILQEIVH
ncbi:hypothetical protein EMCRGX_G028291 [Ephydatia muelleri]